MTQPLKISVVGGGPGGLAALPRKSPPAGVNIERVYVATTNRVGLGAAAIDALKKAPGKA